MKKNCEDCIDTDIADWEINENTGKATPVLWCERYKKFCSDISECGKEGRKNDGREGAGTIKKFKRLDILH